MIIRFWISGWILLDLNDWLKLNFKCEWIVCVGKLSNFFICLDVCFVGVISVILLVVFLDFKLILKYLVYSFKNLLIKVVLLVFGLLVIIVSGFCIVVIIVCFCFFV